MKKTFKILAFSLFAITGFTVASCDNEGYDPVIEGEKGVGKRLVTIDNQGDVIMHREGVVAVIDKNGKVEIVINGADTSGKDILILRAGKFQIGTFPTNAPLNESNYKSVEHNLWYTTNDTLRPNVITGLLEISEINRKARVLSGDFKISRMMPTNDIDPNLKAFPISGDFKDIPFVRKEATYVETFVNGKALENPSERAEVKDNRIIITSIDEVEMTEELILDFPGDEELEVMSDPKDFKKLGWFKVTYTSKYGIKYTSEGVNENEGYMRFDMAEKDKVDSNKFNLKGRFEANLVGVDNPDDKVKLTFGDFSVILVGKLDK